MFKKILLSTTLFLATLNPSWALNLEGIAASAARFESPNNTASGVFIKPNFVLTARHVVEDLPRYGAYVIDSLGVKHRILNVQVSYDADVAMVEVDQPNADAPVAEVSCRMPDRFETLISVGNPVGYKDITSPVMVVGFNDDRDVDDVTSVVIAGATGPGMSGGPLFDKDGKVVAVLSNILLFKRSAGDTAYQASAFTNVVPLIAVPELCVKQPETPATDMSEPSTERQPRPEAPANQ